MKSKNTKFGGHFYRFGYKIWRLLPEDTRQFVYKKKLLNRTKILFRNTLGSVAGRDDIYNEDYYVLVDAMAQRSVSVMTNSIMNSFAPKSLVDVGCGTGALLDAFKKRGVHVLGYEYSAAALEICRARGLGVISFDLTRDWDQSNNQFDVALSTEVAEHIDDCFADRLVEFLVRRSRKIVFTAATPGQGGGIDHVNEQPNSYWIEKFSALGYRLENSLTHKWRAEWEAADIEACYFRNVMVFVAS